MPNNKNLTSQRTKQQSKVAGRESERRERVSNNTVKVKTSSNVVPDNKSKMSLGQLNPEDFMANLKNLLREELAIESEKTAQHFVEVRERMDDQDEDLNRLCKRIDSLETTVTELKSRPQAMSTGGGGLKKNVGIFHGRRWVLLNGIPWVPTNG